MWKRPQCLSADEWMKKAQCIETMGYSSAIFILSFVTGRMDLEGITLSEISQTDEHSMISLTHGI